MSQDTISVNPIFTLTTPIKYRGFEGGGTGFFMNSKNGETYLISNKHVINPEEIDPKAITIRLRDFDDVSSTRAFEIELDQDDDSWYAHPEDPDIDIAVVPLDIKLSSIEEVIDDEAKTGSLALTIDHIIHENMSVHDNVMIIGYPENFTDSSHYYPLRRNALIASPYQVPYNENHYFITDARMHSGMSGSPVVMDTSLRTSTTGTVPSHRKKNITLVGVHSDTFYDPNDEQKGQEESRYDLNAAWYPDLISDIIGCLGPES